MTMKNDELVKDLICKEEIMPGDLIGFSSWDWTGFVINVGSLGIPFIDLSHVGIVADFERGLALFESTTLSDQPCLVQKKVTSGAQVHSIIGRVANYNGLVYHIPLYRPLNYLQRKDLTEFLMKDVGKPYDMLGAFRSGGHLFAKMESILRPEEMNNLFCSEWAMGAWKASRVFQTKSASKWNPNSMYRTALRREVCQRRYLLKVKS